MKKKSAKPVVDEVVEKSAPEITISKKEVDEVLHYYRCNITINNGKSCNCSAFM